MPDEQLVAYCQWFGLDSSGRSKHLRERLLRHIGEQEGAVEEPPEGGDEVTHPCPDCGGDLTYVEQYDAWYCGACEKYAPISEDE
jgi:hypothetical protein